MKCPKCVEEGRKSTLTPHGGTVTCVYYQPYYDEEGVYHNHDGNKRKQSYSCSNGHSFEITLGKSCPNCDWEIKEEVRIFEKSEVKKPSKPLAPGEHGELFGFFGEHTEYMVSKEDGS